MKKEHKNTVIILYGAMGVGKLTIGEILAKKLKFNLTHNHLINDLVSSVFKKGEAYKLIEDLRYYFYRKCAESQNNIIITHCYSHNFTSPTGLRDPKYLKDLENIFKKNNTKTLFVHLQAEPKELLKRITSESRKKYKKLTKTSIMKEILKTEDFKTSGPVKNNLIIDNTNLNPNQVVNLIIKELKK